MTNDDAVPTRIGFLSELGASADCGLEYAKQLSHSLSLPHTLPYNVCAHASQRYTYTTVHATRIANVEVKQTESVLALLMH
jgi:hypothetical protein